MKVLRIYIDTSVVGGCFDDKFSLWSNRLVADFQSRRYTPYLLPILYRWLSAVPVLTDNLLSKYIPMASIEFELETIK